MTSFHQSSIGLTLDHVSPATLLLEKRRRMLEVQQALDTQKEEYARKESMFRRREQQLRKKDLELQENLCQFNKFLKDKADKRQQYLKKTVDEKRIKLIKKKELHTKKNELRKIFSTCNNLESEFKAHEKYEKYLECIKQKSDEEFPEIEYILKRFNLLNEARVSLECSENESASHLEVLRIRSLEYNKEQNNKYLDLNNEKQRLQRRLEYAMNESNSFETQLSKIVETNTNRNRELGQLIMCVRNIYQRCKLYLRGIHHFQDFEMDFNLDSDSDSEYAVEVKTIETESDSLILHTQQNDCDRETQFEISQKLEIIAHYIRDCQSIVEEHQNS